MLPTVCRLLRGDRAPRFGSEPQGQASQPRADVVEAGSIGSPSNRNERPSNAATADTTSRNRDVKSLRCCRLAAAHAAVAARPRFTTRLFFCATTYIVDHFHCANGRVKHSLLIRYLGF